MLSIDEAIEKHKKLKIHAERANDKRGAFYSAEEHKQIAEWMEELKILKSLKNCSFMTIGKTVEQFEQEIRCRAIDDFTEKIKENISESLIWGMIADCFKYKNMNDTSDKIVDYVINTANEIAEQLKAGGK